MAATLEFRTTLENFTGPLDLLLYLIRKDEIDILAIPIAQVLEQYEQFVRFLADIDVNLAADYLVMATTLMEIKSRMLLPPAPGAEEGGGSRMRAPCGFQCATAERGCPPAGRRILASGPAEGYTQASALTGKEKNEPLGPFARRDLP